MSQLQEQWQFPSDHLPIGITLNGIEVVSWNVLNTSAIGWIVDKDVQGLKRSMIGVENVPSSIPQVTQRDLHVADLLKKMNYDLIGLQECSLPFLRYVNEHLPTNCQLVAILDDPSVTDQTAIIYRSDRLRLLESKNVPGVFSSKKWRLIQDLRLVNTDGFTFHCFNTHLPGAPGDPSPNEMREFLQSIKEPFIAMGDMNTTADQLEDPSYDVISPYNSNVHPLDLIPVSIDHFMTNASSYSIYISEPDDILEGLSATWKLIN